MAVDPFSPPYFFLRLSSIFLFFFFFFFVFFFSCGLASVTGTLINGTVASQQSFPRASFPLFLFFFFAPRPPLGTRRFELSVTP